MINTVTLCARGFLVVRGVELMKKFFMIPLVVVLSACGVGSQLSGLEKSPTCRMKYDVGSLDIVRASMRDLSSRMGMKYYEDLYPTLPTLVISVKSDDYEITARNSFAENVFSVWIYKGNLSTGYDGLCEEVDIFLRGKGFRDAPPDAQ